MSTTNKIAYATSTQIACTLTSLATGSARESAIIDNTSALADDYELTVTVTVGSGTPTSTGAFINVWLSGTEDGSTWPAFYNGTTQIVTGGGDAAQGALGSTNNLTFLGAIQLSTSTNANPYTLRQTFSGLGFLNMFRKWSVLIDNETGIALSTSTATTSSFISQTAITYTNG